MVKEKMHLIFERSEGRFRSNCNILTLAWMPYYNEIKFRKALFEHHQRQFINLTCSIAINSLTSPSRSRNLPPRRPILGSQANDELLAVSGSLQSPQQISNNNSNVSHQDEVPVATINSGLNNHCIHCRQEQYLNSRIAELHQRYLNSIEPQFNNFIAENNDITTVLDSRYGRMADFGWLVVGNVGKIVGVTLTSIVPAPKESPVIKGSQLGGNNKERDLIVFQDDEVDSKISDKSPNNKTTNQQQCDSLPKQSEQLTPSQIFELERPDKRCLRNNHNLRGHLDEVILVKWNELYQKLATIDSKGNVLIWCKINEKFTIQTPFYNRAKSVADFKWSNDGKTALICYTDSFILVGSSSGQRHWHSMLNLDDYHITCASWTPNDEKLLLGVSNGNVVVIDLPRSELTELVVNQTNVRNMCWSTSEINLKDTLKLSNSTFSSQSSSSTQVDREQVDTKKIIIPNRRSSIVVNHRRLSRDCSVFSRYRFCSAFPTYGSATNSNNNSFNGSSQSRARPDLYQDETQTNQLHGGSTSTDNNCNDRDMSSFCKEQSNILAIDFANNIIKLFDGGLDDSEPKTIQVNLESYLMQWSGDGKVLAVAGFNIHTTAPSVGCLRCRYLNAIKFFNQRGQLIYEYTMRYTRYPITAFTWAHEDKRIFIATGPKLHCAKVFPGIPNLSLLTMSCFQRFTKLPHKSDIMESILDKRFSININNWQSYNCPINLKLESKRRQEITTKLTATSDDQIPKSLIKVDHCNNNNVFRYKLPLELQMKIDELFAQTIRQPFDENWSLNDIIWHVPKHNQRYYCTLVCYTSDREINSTGYQYQTNMMDKMSDNYTSDQNKLFVLYVEFEGSLIPILRARRVGFLKPEFVIFDPEDNQYKNQRQRKVSDVSQQSFLNNYMQRKFDQHNNLSNNFQSSELTAVKSLISNSSPFYFNDGFSDNCSDLHLYTEARTSGSIGHQSMASDAEHYYNFECDTTNRQNSNRMADFVSDRSHHQEPIAMPMTSNPYLMYMLSMSAGNQHIRNRQQLGPTNTPSKRQRDHYKLRNPGLRSSLTETNELIRIKSNIWGTKFKLLNVSNRMIKQRSVLGSVVYTASILHLQPREIFLKIRDMSNYCCLCSTHHHSHDLSSKSFTPDKKRNINCTKNKEVNLIDLPNVESPLITPLSSSSEHDSRKNRKRNRHHLKSELPREKVVLEVGDRVRITPKLEPNQQYKFAGNYIVDNQRPTTSRASSSHRKKGGSESENKVREYNRTQVRSFSKANMNHLRLLDGSSFAVDSVSSPSLMKSTDIRKNPLVKKFHPKEDSSATAMEAQDDILTLSLDQGDQVRVDMSSIRSIDGELLEDEKNTTRNPSMDEFLATNKNLKSIQTITKMIVDLSSKADDIGGEEVRKESKYEIEGNTDSTNMSSPSKLLKLSNEVPSSQVVGYPSPSKYVAPDPPVHRPRRIASKLPSNKFQTQSATTTPLRVVRGNRTTGLSKYARRGETNRSKEESLFNPLPPEPPQAEQPSVPIGRRLSSSAKRFIDGSLRSLYSSGYSITTSDSEPEDGEPLVSNHASFGVPATGGGFPRGIRQRFFGGQSQPCTPVKSLRKQPSDLTLLREQLLHKLRGKTLIFNDRQSYACRTQKNSKSSTSGSSCLNNNSSQDDGNNKSRNKSLDQMAARHYRNTSPDSSSDDELSISSSSSAELSSSSDDDFQLTSNSKLDSSNLPILKNGRAKSSRRFNAGSSSVKDLRDVGLEKVSNQVEGKAVGQRKGGRRNQRRHRKHKRKSICLNSSCCCAKEFRLNNRPPVWNDVNQIYQLDFGGRVTQESAKNLQIDFEGNLALQFGRIDRCTYTLDYKYPFNAVQAMAIALASLTQRLK